MTALVVTSWTPSVSRGRRASLAPSHARSRNVRHGAPQAPGARGSRTQATVSNVSSSRSIAARTCGIVEMQATIRTTLRATLSTPPLARPCRCSLPLQPRCRSRSASSFQAFCCSSSLRLLSPPQPPCAAATAGGHAPQEPSPIRCRHTRRASLSASEARAAV